VWNPELVWTTWRREISLLYRDSNSYLSVFQAVASLYTDYAIPAHSNTYGIAENCIKNLIVKLERKRPRGTPGRAVKERDLK
jgi:hypothetical protein